ncbi:hypothetical protein HID58_063035 [Brassica napus]|uniref:(rape) hypothetical protein n=1 Tax=Brassica napus TaxID=3708 RepID=A0A817B306_BRANA|nr:hypothetical protein HID58_063035 [Brassica napus]CAF2292998.1 unnamed protein product [Brassica napus]
MACCYASLWIALGIEPRLSSFYRSDRFAFGYDNNLNHKILSISNEIHPVTSKHVSGELYDFTSSSWKVLDDVTPEWMIRPHRDSVSLKGNAYFLTNLRGFFICFDFTTESFGPLLPLPLRPGHGGVSVSLSCVREDQLAVLYQHSDKTIEISVTDKIGPDVVSWTKFLKLLTGFRVNPNYGSFFIDEKKKIAVVFVLERAKACRYQTAHVNGQNGYFKSVRIREAPYLQNGSSPRKKYHPPPLCSSYLPSFTATQPTRLMETNVIIFFRII